MPCPYMKKEKPEIERLGAAIDFSTMADPHGENEKNIFTNLIDNPVAPDSDSVEMSSSGQLLWTRRARRVSEKGKCKKNSLLAPFGELGQSLTG